MNLQDFGESVGILAGLPSAGTETPQQGPSLPAAPGATPMASLPSEPRARISGGVSGIVHSRVGSSLKNSPSKRVSLPAKEFWKSPRMTSMASNIRLIRSGNAGQ